MSIVDTERETYEGIWAHEPYGERSPGERYVDAFMEMSGATSGTVLDAGIGSGKGALALQRRGFFVDGCDITANGLIDEAKGIGFSPLCLWDDVRRIVGDRDWVYCCDVMEHIPTPFTMLVARRLLDASIQGVFFSISLTTDVYGVWVGKHLHQTVQSFVEWRDQLSTLGRMVECRDLGTVGLYFVAPR